MASIQGTYRRTPTNHISSTMQITTLGLWAIAVSMINAAHISVASVDAIVTAAPSTDSLHQKRFKEVVVNKDYKKFQDLKNGKTTSTTEIQKPWIRTIYDNKVEIVTPTVVAGVTLSAKPPATTNGLEPWISLNKDGSPKTINPKLKNGVIKNKSPDYSTWFQTATTIKYTKEELQAHNMADDQVFHEEVFVPEDLTYRLLNPIMRCTPDSYKMKGMGKDVSPEPFCFPRDEANLYVDRTYFVTWYSRFFDPTVKNVRLHLSQVKESYFKKGVKTGKSKRSAVIEKGGSLNGKSFFVSGWIPVEEGMFILDVLPEWIDEGQFQKKVLISLQPETVDDENFNPLQNYVIVDMSIKAKVSKEKYKDPKLQQEMDQLRELYGDDFDIDDGLDYERYITIITMPTMVLIAVGFMYVFVWYNKRGLDLGFLKKAKLNRQKLKTNPRGRGQTYTELPQWSGPKND